MIMSPYDCRGAKSSCGAALRSADLGVMLIGFAHLMPCSAYSCATPGIIFHDDHGIYQLLQGGMWLKWNCFGLHVHMHMAHGPSHQQQNCDCSEHAGTPRSGAVLALVHCTESACPSGMLSWWRCSHMHAQWMPCMPYCFAMPWALATQLRPSRMLQMQQKGIAGDH